jgi:hypothetical protein
MLSTWRVQQSIDRIVCCHTDMALVHGEQSFCAYRGAAELAHSIRKDRGGLGELW